MTNEPQILDEILRIAVDRVQTSQSLPGSTYRLQFHADFTFKDAAAIVPYLSNLGITHVYASPYLKATPGSMHGYDVIDHSQLNPELGTTADFKDFLAALRQRGMGHIADVVPNHVGIATNDNAWWNDVLENGPASIYASYFDINWEGSPQTDLQGRVLLPTLGKTYGEELEQGNLKLLFENGGFFVAYHDRRFPVSPRTYPLILQSGIDSRKTNQTTLMEYRSIMDACHQLPGRCDGSAVASERHQAKEKIKSRLAKLAGSDEAIQTLIAQNLETLNGVPGAPQSFDELDHLLRHQCFRLACWKTAPDEINYRRFFDVNELAALSMERLEVFKATHGLILGLLAKQDIAGIRIDHPDGLYDPRTYFQRLQTHYALAAAREAANSSTLRELDWDEQEPRLLKQLEEWIATASWNSSGPPLYVLGEKILACDEPIPKTWPIHGTSGYEFLNMTNGLFVDSRSADAFDELYRDWTGLETSFDDLAFSSKKLILEISLASELSMLAGELKKIAGRSRHGIDFSLHALHDALKEVIACFPVYRSYIDADGPSAADISYVEQAVASAVQRHPKTEPAIFTFIRDTLLAQEFSSPSPGTPGEGWDEGNLDRPTALDTRNHPHPNPLPEYRERGPEEATPEISRVPTQRVAAMGSELAACRHFAGKFQQLTSPVMAKGVEDTAFYIYNRLLSLNEVGGSPSRFGVSPQELHTFFQQRQRDWPYAMSTLSTHDTKRSEDVRARLNVLSEMPGEWQTRLRRWGDLNASLHTTVAGSSAPDRNEEYALYQTLLGAWPTDPAELSSFKKRVQTCMLKSMREAKVSTRWTDPNLEWEAAMDRFIDAILDDSRSGAFLTDFQEFQRQISRFGKLNSLSQSLLKLTAPGVPDTYQGNESWDFSLVDPDNRRPVDFTSRARVERVQRERKVSAGNSGEFPRDHIGLGLDDGLKLHVHRTVLHLRTKYKDLFTIGKYLPLATRGDKAQHLFAFARSHAEHVAVVVAPRLIAGMTDSSETWPEERRAWGDTCVELPASTLGRGLRNALTGSPVQPSGPDYQQTCLASALFANFPVALLLAE